MYDEALKLQIQEELEARGHNIVWQEERARFRYTLRVDSAVDLLDVYICLFPFGYCIYVHLPFRANVRDPMAMESLSEYICRVNFGLNYGVFEVDYDEGDVRYRYFVSCPEGTVLPEKVLENSLNCPVVLLERYGIGFLKVMFGEFSPKAVVRACESDNTIPDEEEA